MLCFTRCIFAAVISLSANVSPVFAYPIDCAIAICMPGGFSASAECTRAKVEVLRRLTPPTIEPPIQLWRCPMNTGVSLPGMGADGSTPEMRTWRSSIEVWMLQKQSSNSSGGRESSVYAHRSYYNDTGDFVGGGVQIDAMPDWIKTEVQKHTPFPLESDHGNFRAIVFKYGDYDQGSTTEWFTY